MSGLVLQFGSSRFLQAHVDLFLQEAKDAGQDVPTVVVVQTSGAPERAGRLAAFSDPAGFPVVIRGLVDGVPTERRITVRSVSRGLSTGSDWAEVVALAAREATVVVSNTGDSGYTVDMAEAALGLGTEAPRAAFPAKLVQLLHARWRAGGAPLTILPCELVSRNGPVLREIVRTFAATAGAEAAFLSWLDESVVFANTLVDRIVSEPLAPAGAVAEPYALWAIETAPGLVLPCRHPVIVLTDTLDPYERLKLHILNLGHTVLADIWLTDGRPERETVREILADAGVRAQLDAIYRDEVLPGFAARGMGDAAASYLETTMSRFLNPYLDHRIADITANHRIKVERRIASFLAWAGMPAPKLQAIAAAQKVAA